MFGLDSYHVFLTSVGACVIVAYWTPRFFSGREPAASALLIAAGALVSLALPGIPRPFDPTSAPHVWEIASELTLIVALFGAGLRIDNIFVASNWGPTVRLLAIAMPLTIAAMAFAGWALAGFTVAGAILLAAALAPTDPVLAGDLQVGPPLEGGEHPARFALTTEAGLNDGLAFPFVLLGLVIAAEGFAPGSWGLEWLGRDVLYRIVVGALSGAAVGWLLGKVTFSIPRKNTLARTESGVLALAGVLLGYGVTELAEGYGFIAAFMTGLVFRRAEEHHEFHRRLHVFTESVEHALTALLLVMLGGALPVLWPALDWRYLALGALLILVIRPVAAYLSLLGTHLTRHDRAVVSFYGVRGIGSIYYLAYASGYVEFVDETALWAMVAFTIFGSTVIHGLTSGIVVDRLGARGADRIRP